MRRLILRNITQRTPALRTAATIPSLRTRLFSSCEDPSSPYEEPEWNAFDVLGVTEKFKIDEGDLKMKYRKLMNEYHPDRNRQSAADEQDEMRDKSSAVTKAYQELTSPHTRAAHLMALRGKPMDETLSQSDVGMEFLMRVMEVREEVENVEAGKDEGLRPLLVENEKRIAETCNDLENAHEKGDLDRALQLTARLQYWNRVTETIREKMESIE